jgi:hypothetical protein
MGTVSVTIPAGTYLAETQEEANAMALAEACAQVAALRDDEPCETVFEASITISSRTREGAPELVGCEEFGTPSVPPRFYRRVEESGSLWSEFSQNFVGDCSGDPQSTTTVVYGSHRQYDPDTGAVSFGGVTTLNGSPVGAYQTTCDVLGSAICHADPPEETVGTVDSTTQCRKTATGTCCQELTGLGSIVYSYQGFGEQFKNLSDEDLEADAIARFRTANPYGAWVECATLESTPSVNPLACSPSEYEVRTAGRTWFYQESETKVEVSGLTPGTEYLFRFEITRTDLDTLASVVSGYIDVQQVADGAGEITDEFAVPVTAGYRYEITDIVGSVVP